MESCIYSRGTTRDWHNSCSALIGFLFSTLKVSEVNDPELKSGISGGDVLTSNGAYNYYKHILLIGRAAVKMINTRSFNTISQMTLHVVVIVYK